jgi:biopolymer transport protein TolR
MPPDDPRRLHQPDDAGLRAGNARRDRRTRRDRRDLFGSLPPQHGSEALQPRGQINVTPLIDVCLVLLLIFMVITPMLRRRPDIDLPRTQRPQPLTETARQLTISILPDGSATLGQHCAAEPDLPAMLRQAHLADADRRVVIQADRRLKYRAVLAVLQQVSQAGFKRAGLATRRLGPSDPPRPNAPQPPPT